MNTPTKPWSRILEDLICLVIGLLVGLFGCYEWTQDHARPVPPPPAAQANPKAEAAPKLEDQSLAEAEQSAAKLSAALKNLRTMPASARNKLRRSLEEKQLRESISRSFEELATQLKDTVEGTPNGAAQKEDQPE